MNFEELVKKLSPKIQAITKKLDRKNLFLSEEDLYQEAMIYLWDKWKRAEVFDKTESYLLQGCSFYLKNYIRKTCKKIDLNLISLNDFINDEENTLDKILFSHDWEKQYDSDEINLLIEQIKLSLSTREKNVFLFFMQGLTTREIGQKLGISHVSVVNIEKCIKNKCLKFTEELF